MSERPDLATGLWIVAHAELARTLWDEGVLASEIARRVGHGATKNSIVGYAHRHSWPPRPSPIAINGLRPVDATPRKPPQSSHKPKGKGAPAKPKRAPAARPLPAPAPARPEPTPSNGCTWIEGPGRPWTMCGAPVVSPGCAWCAVHRAKVYVRRHSMPVAA